MSRYLLEFTLNVHGITAETVRNSILEFGEALEVARSAPGDNKEQDLKVSIATEDPTIIFDVCAQFGRIRSVRVTEENKGENQSPNTANTTE